MSKYLNFQEAKVFVAKLKLETMNDWFAWKQKHPDTPIITKADRSDRYKPHWKGWGDFLSAKSHFVSYKSAKRIARRLKLTRASDWEQIIPPKGLPKYPAYIYADEWEGWYEFLGIKYVSYEKAKAIVRNLFIKDFADWNALKNKPINIPTRPNEYYKEWKGWSDFLGKEEDKFIKLQDGRIRFRSYIIDIEKGTVVSLRNAKRGSRDTYGYLRLHMGSNGTMSVHRLIYMAAHGLESVPRGYQIDHIDGNENNNKASNLQMLSQREHNFKTKMGKFFEHLKMSDLSGVRFWNPKTKKYVEIERVELEQI